MFVIDILQIPSGSIQIFSRCISPTWLRACFDLLRFGFGFADGRGRYSHFVDKTLGVGTSPEADCADRTLDKP
jgi:hypothetical protein